ncbi:polymorphic toxin-type HINT domain-containing protein [Streptomyces sp. NPDC023838]|uniref:polymorphic toxin-type HINT domain-containing protein n=1 Tax=Streptomyces sp. NPDC023838 TaxID=3154325 RepID=UPI0033EAA085
MRTPVPRTGRRRLGSWSKTLAATALAASVALTVSGSGVQPLPGTRPAAAAEDDPGAFDLDKAARIRADQCLLGTFLHKGGAEMKAVARGGLSGTDDELHAAAAPDFWEHTPLDLAYKKDHEASSAKMDELTSRFDAWQNELSYNWSDFTPGYQPWPPGYPGDPNGTIFRQTGYFGWIADQFWTSEHDLYKDITPLASQESADAVTAIAKQRFYPTTYPESIQTYDDRMAFEGMTSMHAMYADDARLFLQYGGFPTSAPDPGSLEFRLDVENLKARFASCATRNPADPHHVLGAELTIAATEWQAEIAGQKSQRDTILDAEAKASKDLQITAQAMGEALGQSMIASRLSGWQAYWTGRPKTDFDYPTPDRFAEIKKRIGNAQARATGRLFVASRAALDAKAQADRVDTAQQQAYAIADAAGQPRGRGLISAQQAAQITKASASAALAASKATETAVNATRASAADSKTLDALAMTQAHASKAEFRRKAAEEAAAQAKAAADGAAVQATKAAENATKAKAAQVKAEAAEKTAKAAAADAKAKRATAEAERDNAKTQRENAAAEQARAAAAEKQAQRERATAAEKLGEAQAAGKTAAEKKDAAVTAEGKAATARDKAVQAESDRDVLAAKADALEAKADADESTDAAEASRAAATRARTAADEATGAASAARAAADAATTAAANAREAATKAEAAAARSKAASDGAQRDVAITNAAVKKAHSAAADAIVASEAAAQNVREAKALADTAQAKAKEAKADATVARTEANAAAATSIQAAGFAYATAQASLAARDSAAQVVKPANDAIELGSPYKESDASAGLAVLTGQAAKTAAEQQQAVARAKAEQAAKAAADAAKLAAQADADAKGAATAAAQAADSAARAVGSLAKAQSSANEAADAAKAARKAEDNTVEYDRQATEDAAAALSASTEAGGYATDARNSADTAEQNASSARGAASAAEEDASTARGVADRAEKDATTAESAAARAQEDAKEAQEAATRAENAEAHRTVETGGATGVGHLFTKQEVTPLDDPKPENDCVLGMGNSGCDVKFRLRFKLTIDFYLCEDPAADENVTAATCPSSAIIWLGKDSTERTAYVTKHFSNWDITKIVDKAFLKSLWEGLTQDFVDCAKGSVSGCAWAASWFVPPAKIAEAAQLVQALDASLHTGIGVTDALHALQALKLDAEVMATIEAEVNLYQNAFTACARNSFPGTTQVLMADGSHKPISAVREGDLLLAGDLRSAGTRPQRVADTYQHDTRRLVDITLADSGLLSSTAGHKFFVVDRGWTVASALRTGDLMRTPDGSLQAVTGIRDRSGLAPTMVYDLTVDGLHTFFVRTAGERPQDVLVHNCLNLIGDEGVSGAHTMTDHVISDLSAQERADKLGRATKWQDADTAMRAANKAFQGWMARGNNAKVLENWKVKQAQRRGQFDPTIDLKEIRWQVRDEGQLGSVFTKGGSGGVPTGNTVILQLKYVKNHPEKFVVYTSFPE